MSSQIEVVCSFLTIFLPDSGTQHYSRHECGPIFECRLCSEAKLLSLCLRKQPKTLCSFSFFNPRLAEQPLPRRHFCHICSHDRSHATKSPARMDVLPPRMFSGGHDATPVGRGSHWAHMEEETSSKRKLAIIMPCACSCLKAAPFATKKEDAPFIGVHSLR